MISPESRIVPLRKLRSYVDQASTPLPDRFESWNFMYREGFEQMLNSDFAASVDKYAPMQLMREVWDSAPSDDLLNRMLWYDWRFTLADNDLRKVGTMCELAGIRVSHPMLHHDVVDLSTRVPSGMKIRGTELRSFFKRAMIDFLPAEILSKKKHGFGLPFGLWLKTDPKLAELIYSLLSDLKARRIIDAEFIDNLVAQHRSGHASYFGYAIWDLAMLEAWLARHIDSL
jgi:asparagine synthase (glutamine-hydrolysing)